MDRKPNFQDHEINKGFHFFFLIVDFGTMLPRLNNDTIICIINLS